MSRARLRNGRRRARKLNPSESAKWGADVPFAALTSSAAKHGLRSSSSRTTEVSTLAPMSSASGAWGGGTLAPMAGVDADVPTTDLKDGFVVDVPRAEDASALRALANDADTAPFFRLTVDQAAEVLDAYFEDFARDLIAGWKRRTRYSFAIRRPADRTLVGLVALIVGPQEREASVSCLVSEPYRSKGLGTRALSAVVEWAVRQTAIDALNYTCDPENEASRRVAENCGFELVEQSDRELRFRRELVAPEL